MERVDFSKVVKVYTRPTGVDWKKYEDGKEYNGTLTIKNEDGFVLATLNVTMTKEIPTTLPQGFSIKDKQVIDGIYNCYMIADNWAASQASKGVMPIENLINFGLGQADQYNVTFASSVKDGDKDKDVTVEEVIKTLLDQEEKNLSPYKDTLSKMNVHEVLTLASISELEGLKDTDRKLIVGVFQNRLSKGMNLGSDVTTYYAFNQTMDKDLTSEMFNTYNPYNTRSSAMAGKLPVGPICNPSIESIMASINPTKSDYYYFVADKNGNVYYTKTSSEHSAKVKELKEKGDWIW